MQEQDTTSIDHKSVNGSRIDNVWHTRFFVADKQKSPEEVEDMLDEGNFNVFSQGVSVSPTHMNRGNL